MIRDEEAEEDTDSGEEGEDVNRRDGSCLHCGPANMASRMSPRIWRLWKCMSEFLLRMRPEDCYTEAPE